MFDVSLEAATFWYDSFNIILFVGAFAVAIATYGSIKMGAVKERFSDERISANERVTAEANARALELQVSLNELSSPRHIDFEIFKKSLEGVAPVKIEIRYAEACSDCFWVATWISNFLGERSGLGWPISIFKPLEANPSGLPPAIAAHASPWGITVVARGDVKENSISWQDDSSANAIFFALLKSMGKRPTVSSNLDATLPADMVRIVVAPRP